MKPAKTTQDAGLNFVEQLRFKARNPGIETYKPHPKQLLFHSSAARQRLFIGGNRSGKTVGGAVEMIYYLTKTHPFKKMPSGPMRMRAVSTDFTKGVDQVMLPMIQRWLPMRYLINGSWEDSYSKKDHLLTLNTGSTLEFMSYDQIVESFAGTSRHGIWFDEEPPEEIYKECLFRLVDTKGDMWATLTPLNGLTWIYDSLYLPGRDPTNLHAFAVEVETDENPFVDTEELNLLEGTFSTEDLQARRKGKFVPREGLVYSEFSTENNVIPPLSHYPMDKIWGCAMDHGGTNPTAWLWFYIDGDGNLIVFDEYYVAGEIVSTHATNIHKINFEHGKLPDYIVGDPSIRNNDPITGTSVLLEYAENGIYIGAADNGKQAGYSRVKKLLEGKGGQKLYITQNCVNLLREISRLHWATYQNKRISSLNNKKEEHHKKDDHACDALRYAVMSRPEFHDNGTTPPDYVPMLAPEAIPYEGRKAMAYSAPKVYDPYLGSEF